MRPRKKSNHFTRGGQVIFHSIRMFFQVNNTIIKFIGFGMLLATLASRLLGEFYYWRNILYAIRQLGEPSVGR
uniref:IncF plasmid conjugative transfer protein TraD n=1 Tax=Vibrio tasmaniensis TaxID=212663 RepID=A0A0H4A3P0_9VIBR|nr:IncF plasmid conjugative transfer protein TraD [Vibrio tasmaniensis]